MNLWLPLWFLFGPIVGLLRIHTLPHPIHSWRELGSPYQLTTPLPFYLSPSPDAWFTMEKSSIITHYIAARGWGRIYTPYNYIWKPSRSWFGARSKKSPWGDYTSSGHAFIPPSPWYAHCLKFLLQKLSQWMNASKIWNFHCNIPHQMWQLWDC